MECVNTELTGGEGFVKKLALDVLRHSQEREFLFLREF